MNNITKEKNGEVKVGLVSAILYIGIMSLGMYLMHYVFNYSYNNAEMVRVIFFVEVVLAILVLIVSKKYYGFRNVGFGKLRISQLKWFIPHIIIISIMTFNFGKSLIQNWSSIGETKLLLLVIIAVTTLLVGFSEEVMFRGILLHSFTNKGKLYTGLIVSSVLFSLLHSVNVFGGMPFNEMITQLISSFILGLFFAPLAIKLKSLVPLIIFHWLWDFTLISSTVIKINISILPIFAMMFNIVLGLLLWIVVRKEKINK